ncbi:hypothetical protein C8F04DRAFT_1181643 [Mycena alexandri]|uniref:Uncharacterized protein n=1 Tax=Mycena alexandri TaxID=1745969 RepID=A0AAD6SYE2_9AGAR|nr:hypothetical protein C8F04DRAFT_1181643 [Mycena alexandri]
MGSSYALTRSSSSLRTLPLTQLNTKLDAMSSNAGPSSSRQTPSRATRGLPKKSPAAMSAPPPATGDFVSPAVPRLRVGAEPMNVNTEFLQEKFSGRKIVARFRLQSDTPHPYPVNLQQVHNSLEHTRMVGEALADKLADLDENPPTLADLRPRPIRATVAPPAPIPSPPLDEAAEEELAEFSRRWQARFVERKALRDNYRATCERVQREHEAVFWAEQDHLQEFWESERTASLADLAAYNEDRESVVQQLESMLELHDRDVTSETRIREGTLSSEWYSTPMTAESQRDTSYSALSVAPLRERRFVVESTVELLELAYRQAPGVLEVIKRDYWS